MNQIKLENFSRSFNSDSLIKQKNKEIKKWRWIVLLCCLLFQMFPFCVANNLMGALMPKDWAIWTNNNQTIMSLTFTIGALVSAFIAPFIAKLFGKQIYTRTIYIIGILATMVGFFSYSINSFIPSYKRTLPVVASILYSSNIITQIGLMIFSGLGINNLISKWWPSNKRGFALGVAYTGGSLGNIWMQQLLQQLAIKFGNNGNLNDDGSGKRWVTYLILAIIGAFFGVVCAIVATRKPLPPNNVFSDIATNDRPILNKTLEATPLSTKKFPIYWVWAIGFLIFELGSVHASLNGQFIANGTAYANNIDPNSLIANGMTVFGIFCLIGNLSGGIINQKLGPTNSLIYAGLMQILAVVILMYSIQVPNLIYLYYALSGLSIYVYTSTPPYICGRLFGVGQSNNHMSILGIFIAVGYAISNSIIGSIMGSGNITTIFIGKIVRSNLLAFSIFILTTLCIGLLIISISTYIIQKKGVIGILEYSPTKFTYVISKKYGFKIWFYKTFILKFIKDVKSNKFLSNLNKNKSLEFNHYKTILTEIKNKYHHKLNLNQIKLLAKIHFYKITLESILKPNCSDFDYLVKNNYVEIKNIQIDNVIKLNPNISDHLSNYDNMISNNNHRLLKLLHHQQYINTIKIEKIQKAIDKLNATPIDIKAQESYTKKAIILETKINKKLNHLKFNNKLSDYKYFEKEYYLLLKKKEVHYLKNKLVIDKNTKLELLHKKINIINFTSMYECSTEIKGYNYLSELLNNEKEFIFNLIVKKINNYYEHKIKKINIKIAHV